MRSGPVDLRPQAEFASALRADTPRRQTSGSPFGRCDPIILAARARHRQGTGVELFYALAVCVSTRAGEWWLRLLGVFPVCDSESGSVFGLITGDPDPGTPSRDRVVPVCNSDL